MKFDNTEKIENSININHEYGNLASEQSKEPAGHL